MLSITMYLMSHPLVAIGLGILVLLCIYNVLRRQVRVAMGLWLLMLVVLFYIYMQAADLHPDTAEAVEVTPDASPDD